MRIPVRLSGVAEAKGRNDYFWVAEMSVIAEAGTVEVEAWSKVRSDAPPFRLMLTAADAGPVATALEAGAADLDAGRNSTHALAPHGPIEARGKRNSTRAGGYYEVAEIEVNALFRELWLDPWGKRRGDAPAARLKLASSEARSLAEALRAGARAATAG